VLAQTFNRTREADGAPEETAPAPARGMAASFDSMEATQRLAALTGSTLTDAAESQSATQAIRSLPRPAPRGWRRRDWLLVGGAAVCGLLVAGAILKRDGRSGKR
jgi:ferric-dicitrate binding protein FerR (iron transport regulator)